MSRVFSSDVPFDKDYYENIKAENASSMRGVSCEDLMKEFQHVEMHFRCLMGPVTLRTASKCSVEAPSPPKPKRDASLRIKSADIMKSGSGCEPTDLDVLMGRGGLTNHHYGNKLYREEADKLREWYVACTKREKYHVSELLVKYIQSYGGRFLEYDEASGNWYEAAPNRARKKASQGLREYKKRKH